LSLPGWVLVSVKCQAVQPDLGLHPSCPRCQDWQVCCELIGSGNGLLDKCLGSVGDGFACPLVLFYIVGLFTNETRLTRWNYIQLTPSLATLILLVAFNWTWMTVLYYFFTAHLFFYIGWTGIHLFMNRAMYMVDDLRWRWAWGVVAGHALIGISFVIQMTFYAPVTYTLNVVVACVVVLALSLYAVSRAKLFTTTRKERPLQPTCTMSWVYGFVLCLTERKCLLIPL